MIKMNKGIFKDLSLFTKITLALSALVLIIIVIILITKNTYAIQEREKIYIGDSRTVEIYKELAGITDNKFQEVNTKDNNGIWIAKYAMAFSWFKNTALNTDTFKNAIAEGNKDIVIMMGGNDIDELEDNILGSIISLITGDINKQVKEYADQYTNYIFQHEEELTANGNRIYITSVNPYGNKSDANDMEEEMINGFITTFNKELKSQINKNNTTLKYIETYDPVFATNYTTKDDFHYNDGKTNKLVYDTVNKFILEDNSNLDNDPTTVTHTVLLKYNATTELSNQMVTVIEGESLGTKYDKSRTGYKFKGWYTDSNLTQSFDVSTPITSDLTLYAKWEAIEQEDITENVTVSFYLDNNKENLLKTVTVEKGKTIEMPSAPTKEGYEFKGWYTDTNLNNKYDFSKTVNDNINLYAAWEATEQEEDITENVTVSFYLDNNKENLLKTVTVEKGKTIEVPSAPTKEGYEFKGWYTDTNLNNKYDFSKTVNDNINLYAAWEATEQEEITPNPVTGIVDNIILGVSLLAVAIVTLIIINKRKEFNKI